MNNPNPTSQKKRPLQRRARGEGYWRRHVNQWRDSGLSQAQYCRENKVALGSFAHWKIKLVGPEPEHSRKVSAPALVPVIVEEKAPPFTIEICIRGTITLRVPSDQNPTIVKHWIEALS